MIIYLYDYERSIMKSTEQGRLAEEKAAEYLKGQDYKIIDRNWRNRYCEIDIIATKSRVMYFVEVKYRASPAHGEGFDYITPKKLKQMSFASDSWCTENRYSGGRQLLAISVSGDNCQDIELIEIT